ncbi:MAG: hypothetical protein M3Z21_11640 [Pseudomonadota bacterium]|nr:hypothetical protein [Pseudomonadota bacterium]
MPEDLTKDFLKQKMVGPQSHPYGGAILGFIDCIYRFGIHIFMTPKAFPSPATERAGVKKA